MVEITSEEQNKVKRMQRAEDCLRDLWDNIKHTNIRIIGVPEEEKKRDSAQISPYMKFTQTTGPTLGGQKPKGRKNSTFKPGKRRPQT